MYSYYTKDYSFPSENNQYKTKGKNLSNPKLISKNKYLKKSPGLEGEKIKEKKNYNLLQSINGKAETIINEYKDESEEPPFKIVRNTRTESYEKIPDYGNYKNFNFGNNKDDEIYGNDDDYDYKYYKVCRKYNGLGHSQDFEECQSNNDNENCQKYDDFRKYKNYRCNNEFNRYEDIRDNRGIRDNEYYMDYDDNKNQKNYKVIKKVTKYNDDRIYGNLGKNDNYGKDYEYYEEIKKSKYPRNQVDYEYYKDLEDYKEFLEWKKLKEAKAGKNKNYEYYKEYKKYENPVNIGNYEDFEKFRKFQNSQKPGNYGYYKEYKTYTDSGIEKYENFNDKNYKDFQKCNNNAYSRECKKYEDQENYEDKGNFRIKKTINYQNYEIPKYNTYKNNKKSYEDLDNNDGYYKKYTIKRQILKEPNNAIRNQPKINKKGNNIENIEISQETKEEDTIDEVKKIESIVDNFKYKETKDIKDPKSKVLVIHKRMCSPTKQVKYIVNSGRKLRNNNSTKNCLRKKNFNEENDSNSFFKNKKEKESILNKSYRYTQPARRIEIFRGSQKSCDFIPDNREVIEEIVENYETKNNNIYNKNDIRNKKLDKEYVIKSRKIKKKFTPYIDDIFEDKRYQTTEVYPEERIVKKKYFVTKKV